VIRLLPLSNGGSINGSDSDLLSWISCNENVCKLNRRLFWFYIRRETGLMSFNDILLEAGARRLQNVDELEDLVFDCEMQL
jgi:hypothetical protein